MSLSVRGLTVTGPAGPILSSLDLDIAAGEIVALTGPSGSGKSLAALAILGLCPLPVTGEVRLNGRALPPPGPGRGTGLILQQPRRALNPIRAIAAQVRDAGGGPEMLARVQFPADRVGAYPFQLSGGLCQRAAIAIALSGRPRLLVADEPTTDLDTVTQAAVLDMLRAQARAEGVAVLLITHDRAVAAAWADREVALAPRPPATSRPRRPAMPGATLLTAEGLTKRFGQVQAVAGATLSLRAGEAVALIGRSGSGKTTLARMIAGLETPDEGRITTALTRREVQIAFQDPAGALDPRLTAAESLREPLRHLAPGEDHAAAIARAIAAAGLDAALLPRRPAQLSGGQRARVGLARALAPGPRLLILDEPTSALDADLAAGVFDRLDALRAEGMGLLIVTHDLSAAAAFCNRALVMEAGRIVEAAAMARLIAAPEAAATRALLAAQPLERGRRSSIRWNAKE